MDPRLIEWHQRLAGIAQNGLANSQDPFDRERFESIRTIAAEMIAENSTASISQVVDFLAIETGHATPKVDVRGVVFKGDDVLLVKERDDGLWSLPGGWAEVGETPKEAVAREVVEESGFQVEVSRLLALHDRRRHDLTPYPFAVYMLFFLCRLTGETALDNPETSEAAFFPRGELPGLSTYRVSTEQLNRVFRVCDDYGLPVELD
ncbi:MAG: hypothetical protein BZY88_14500 [SAR202 cluster bacterium Io17-Chloro-G9]|nr:MAG: hypothetical protein BZY88_14500 [SAR202 cluster bacterium Io17-Chloro-G9]